MKNPSHKTTRLLFASILIAAVACVLQTAYADWQMVSAATDDNRAEFKGLPLSIAFHSNSAGNTEVYVMDSDGSDQTRITFDPRVDQQPDISPDGRHIVFCSTRITDTNPEGDLEIFVMDADGSNVQEFAYGAPGPWNPLEPASD